MKTRDVDMYDVRMLTEISEVMQDPTESFDERTSCAYSGRLLAIAGLLNRHHRELAECEHGALRGRCLVDPCESEDFESDHVVNRATDVSQVATMMELSDAIDSLSFSTTDFDDLLAFAWVGARVLHAGGISSASLTGDRAPEGGG